MILHDLVITIKNWAGIGRKKFFPFGLPPLSLQLTNDHYKSLLRIFFQLGWPLALGLS